MFATGFQVCQPKLIPCKTRGVLPVLAARKTQQKAANTAPSNKPFSGIGFTKTNELFVGRIAMLGFASAVIGEITTGKGILAQFGYETGLGIKQVDFVVGFIVLFNLVAAVLPTSQTFQPDQQKALKDDGREGPVQNPNINILQPRKFFGIKTFGFTKENEIFVGRMAQLGFAFAIIGELKTGKGPLTQFGLETGINLLDSEFLLLASIAFVLFAAINEGTGAFVDDE